MINRCTMLCGVDCLMLIRQTLVSRHCYLTSILGTIHMAMHKKSVVTVIWPSHPFLNKLMF